MKKLILVILALAHLVYADDAEIFEDLGEIEFDEKFADDDFAEIKDSALGSGAKKVANSVSGSQIISEPYQRWAERSVVRKEKSISILGGSSNIGQTYHMTLFPQARFDVWRIFTHLGLPLHLPVYDNSRLGGGTREKGFVSPGTFILPRSPDFRDWSDTQRVFRHVQVGELLDPFYLELSRTKALTLGQGVLVKELLPGGLQDHDYLFAQGHAELDKLRLDGFIGPLPMVELLGLNARVAPLSSLNTFEFIKNTNIDLSYAADFAAPNFAKSENGSYVLDNEKRLVDREKNYVQAFSLGAQSEYYPIKQISLMPYLAYAHMFLGGLKDQNTEYKMLNGAGFHLGHDAKFSLSSNSDRSILLFRTEGRLFSPNYWPSYFGANYMLDRVIVSQPNSDWLGDSLVSKSQYLSTKMSQGMRLGFLLELAFAYEDSFNASIGYESARLASLNEVLPALRKTYLRTNFFALDVLRLNLSYEANFIKEIKYLFDFDNTRALLSLGGQLRLLPNLYFDAWAKHSFGINDRSSELEWLSNRGETRSLNFGLGLELAMKF